MNHHCSLLVLVLSAAFTGEGSATQGAVPAGRVIWRGVMTEMTSSPSCAEQVVQTFAFEGDERETGATWRSRKVTWNQSLTCAKDVFSAANRPLPAPSRCIVSTIRIAYIATQGERCACHIGHVPLP